MNLQEHAQSGKFPVQPYDPSVGTATILSKTALADQATLCHRDYSKRICVFTDASEHIRSAIITKIAVEDIEIANEKKCYEPLAFLSGYFNPTQVVYFGKGFS